MTRAFFHADSKGIALSILNGCDGYSSLVDRLKNVATAHPH